MLESNAMPQLVTAFKSKLHLVKHDDATLPLLEQAVRTRQPVKLENVEYLVTARSTKIQGVSFTLVQIA